MKNKVGQMNMHSPELVVSHVLDHLYCFSKHVHIICMKLIFVSIEIQRVHIYARNIISNVNMTLAFPIQVILQNYSLLLVDNQ